MQKKLNSATTLIQYNQGGSPMEAMYYIGLNVRKKTIDQATRS